MLGFSALSARSICGQLTAVIPPPVVVTGDTHDYPFPAADGYRKRVQRAEKLQREFDEKRLKANNIREEIDRILYPKEEESGEIQEKTGEIPEKTPVLTKKEQRSLADLELKLAALMAELMLVAEQQRLEAIAYRKWRDEEDMKVILAAMNSHLQFLQ